ncbi:MAG: DUF5915 domain-containing protein, partial [Promethearchaeia archaeon]
MHSVIRASTLLYNKLLLEKFEHIIKSELNVKELNFIPEDKAKSLYEEDLILDHGAIGKDFKQDRLKVEEYLKSQEVEDIRNNFLKGKLKVKLDGKEFVINKDHFEIEQQAKEPYAVNLANYGTVLINSELNDDLLQEGFVREFIRNVQHIRKNLELSRFKEYIELNVVSDINLEKEL